MNSVEKGVYLYEAQLHLHDSVKISDEFGLKGLYSKQLVTEPQTKAASVTFFTAVNLFISTQTKE